MQIRDLKLVNFRSYERLNLEFDESLNLIVGKNGMGKTNIIEAIYVLALTKSFRTNTDGILIKNEQDSLKIKAHVWDKVVNEYEMMLTPMGKKVKINGTNATRLSDYISKINVILFSPNDLRIIKDTPSIRRKMLNIEISQLNSSYLKNLQDYNKLLKQRNSYLKTLNINGNASQDYIDILTEQLIDIGLNIYKERQNFINLLNESMASLYKKITNIDGLMLEYISDYKNMTKEKLLPLYKKSKERDMMFGKTHIGIHHDDIAFKLKDENLKEYGSEGQQKNAIIALKLAEIRIFYEQKKTYPILILDDLFSELDKEKINNILSLLEENIQTFITTTDIENLNEEYLNKGKIFKIEDMHIKEVTHE